MPTRAVFRCQFCDAVPDHGTQRSLAGQVTERMFGEYLDAFPGRWLVWNGGGPLGPRRYACREHRGDLVAYLRYHYATVAAQVWKMPPYQQRWPDEKRPHMGGSMGIIKFGLRGGLLQDRPPAAPPSAPTPPTSEPASAAGERSGEAPPAGGASATGPAGASAETGTSPDDEQLPGNPSPEDAPEGETAGAEGLFPPGLLLGPAEPYTPDDPLLPDELFPPGELYLPTDGPFAPEGDAPADAEHHEESPPLSDQSPGEDEGPWPAEPGSRPD